MLRPLVPFERHLLADREEVAHVRRIELARMRRLERGRDEGQAELDVVSPR
jgi:hypothetical protein